jgi:N6-adenosine-specific RNA methylase IME4
VKYKTIVIDPPWPGPGNVPAFDSELSAGKIASVLIPYSTMTGIQVAALRVSEIATMDAQLWLWCCSRSVGDAFLLCQAWGFKYRGLFVWRKMTGKGGLGMNMRNQCEFLLWGARHGARISHGADCPWQVHEWRRPKRHSEKPAEAYELIRSLSDGPRIDIFARQHRPGFTPWGNEVPQSGSMVGGPK